MGNCCVAASAAQGYTPASRTASGLPQIASLEVKFPASSELPVAQKHAYHTTRLPAPHTHASGSVGDTTVLDHDALQQLYADHLEPVAALCIAHVHPIRLPARSALESDSSGGTRPSPTGSIAPTCVTARLVHTEHHIDNNVGNHAGLHLVISSEAGSVTLRCILANTSARQALALSTQQDILRFLDDSFKRDAGFLAIFHDIVMRLLSGQLASVTHFVPGHFGAGRSFLNMKMSPFVYRATSQVPADPNQNSGPCSSQTADAAAAAAGTQMHPDERPGIQTCPGASSGRDGGDVCDGGGGAGVIVSGGVTPAMILELDVPYEGKELAARLQRDYMIISNIPSIVTMFDTSGRVLHQNLPSITFMGQRVAAAVARSTTALPVDTACSLTTTALGTTALHNTSLGPPLGSHRAAAAGPLQPTTPPNVRVPSNQHRHRTASLRQQTVAAVRSCGAREEPDVGASVGAGAHGDGRRGSNVTDRGGSGGSDQHGDDDAVGEDNVFRALFAMEPEKGEQAWRAACAGKEWQGVVMMPPYLGLDRHDQPTTPPPTAVTVNASADDAIADDQAAPAPTTTTTPDAIPSAPRIDLPQRLNPQDRTQPQAPDKVRQRHLITRPGTGASTGSSSGCGSQALEAASWAAWPVQQHAAPAAAASDPRVSEVPGAAPCGGVEADSSSSKPGTVAAQLAAIAALLQTGSSWMVEVPDAFYITTDSGPLRHPNNGAATGSRSVLDTTFSLEVLPTPQPQPNPQHNQQQQTQDYVNPSVATPAQQEQWQQQQQQQHQEERRQQEETPLLTRDSTAQLIVLQEQEQAPSPTAAPPATPLKQQQGEPQVPLRPHTRPPIHPACRELLYASYYSNSSSEPGRPYGTAALLASSLRSLSFDGAPGGGSGGSGGGGSGGDGNGGGAACGDSGGDGRAGGAWSNCDSNSAGSVPERVDMIVEEELPGSRYEVIDPWVDTNGDDVNADAGLGVIAAARDSQVPARDVAGCRLTEQKVGSGLELQSYVAGVRLPAEVEERGDNEGNAGDAQDVNVVQDVAQDEGEGTWVVRDLAQASYDDLELSFLLEKMPHGAVPSTRTSKATSSTTGIYIRFSGTGTGWGVDPASVRSSGQEQAVKQGTVPAWDAVATAASAPASEAGCTPLKTHLSPVPQQPQHRSDIPGVEENEEEKEEGVRKAGDVAVAGGPEAVATPLLDLSRAPQPKALRDIKSDSTAPHIELTSPLRIERNTPEIVVVGGGNDEGGSSGGGKQPGDCGHFRSGGGLLVPLPPEVPTPAPPVPPLLMPSSTTSSSSPQPTPPSPSSSAPSPTPPTAASTTTAAATQAATAPDISHLSQQPTTAQDSQKRTDSLSLRLQVTPGSRSRSSLLLLPPPTYLPPRAAETLANSNPTAATTTTTSSTPRSRTGPNRRPSFSAHLPPSPSRRALIKPFRRLSSSSPLVYSSASPSPPSAATHLPTTTITTTTTPGPKTASTGASPLSRLGIPSTPTAGTTLASPPKVTVTITSPTTPPASHDPLCRCPVDLPSPPAAFEPSACRLVSANPAPPTSHYNRPRTALMNLLTSALGGRSGGVPHVATAAASVPIPGRTTSASRLVVPSGASSAARPVTAAAAMGGGDAARIGSMGTQQLKSARGTRSEHGLRLNGTSRHGAGVVSRGGDVGGRGDSGRSQTGERSHRGVPGDKAATGLSGLSDGGAGGGGGGTGGGVRWHEVAVRRCCDPVSGQPVVLVVQTDVTSQVAAEAALLDALEAEYRLLSEVLPQHVVQHMMQQLRAEAEVERQQQHAEQQQHLTGGGGGSGSGGSGGGGVSRPVSAFRHALDPAALATLHDCVTVLFADIKGFTEMSKKVTPGTVMTFLNDLYTRFDSLTDVYGVYKVETIGDCYMVAGGLVARDGDGYGRAVRGAGDTDPLHAMRVVAFARAMLEEAAKVALPNSGEPVKLRIGIHSGSVMSGVVGQKMPRFCLFGDTINTASRMESTGQPGGVHISSETRALLPSEEDEEGWLPIGGVDVKGKGRMDTFFWWPQSERAIRQRSSAEQRARLLATLSNMHPPSPPPPPRPLPTSRNTSFSNLTGAQTQVHSAAATVGFAGAVSGPCGQGGSFKRGSYS